MSILAVQNLMQWEKLLEKARRVWFNRKWKQVVVLKGARRDGGGTGSIPDACLTSDDLERAAPHGERACVCKVSYALLYNI